MKKQQKKKNKKRKKILPRDPNVSSGSLYMRKRGLIDQDKNGIKKEISNQKRRQEDKEAIEDDT